MVMANTIVSRDFWTKTKTLQLIELYGQYYFLWDSSHKLYRSKQKRIEGYLTVAEELGTSVDEVKRKLDCLLAQYRREKIKTHQVELGEREYKDAWWGLKPLSFLDDQYHRKHPLEASAKSEYKAEEGSNDAVRNNGLMQQAGHEVEGIDIDIAQMQMQINNDETIMVDGKASPTPVPAPLRRALKRRLLLKKKEPIKIMKVCYPEVAHRESSRDEFSAYAETVANRLRSLANRKTCLVAMNQIDNLLFSAQMEELDAGKELITFIPADAGTFDQVCEQTLDHQL